MKLLIVHVTSFIPVCVAGVMTPLIAVLKLRLDHGIRPIYKYRHQGQKLSFVVLGYGLERGNTIGVCIKAIDS